MTTHTINKYKEYSMEIIKQVEVKPMSIPKDLSSDETQQWIDNHYRRYRLDSGVFVKAYRFLAEHPDGTLWSPMGKMFTREGKKPYILGKRYYRYMDNGIYAAKSVEDILDKWLVGELNNAYINDKGQYEYNPQYKETLKHMIICEVEGELRKSYTYGGVNYYKDEIVFNMVEHTKVIGNAWDIMKECNGGEFNAYRRNWNNIVLNDMEDMYIKGYLSELERDSDDVDDYYEHNENEYNMSIRFEGDKLGLNRRGNKRQGLVYFTVKGNYSMERNMQHWRKIKDVILRVVHGEIGEEYDDIIREIDKDYV